MKDDVSRRDALRLGAATAGLGVTASMAGCSAVQDAVPFIGGGAGYTNWLSAPGVINDDRDHYNFSYTNYKQIRNNEDNFDEDVYDSYEGAEDSFPMEPMGLDFDEVNTRLSASTGGVIEGQFKKDDVVGELEDNDYEEDGDHEGYTMLVKQEAQGVAVKNNTAVFARLGYYGGGDQEPADILELLIDTKKGNEDRYAKEEEDFKTLTNKLGSGTFVFGGTQEEVDETNEENGRFEGTVASGAVVNVNGETTKLKSVTVFGDADDIDMGDVEDYIDESDSFDDYDNVSSNKNGRSVVIKGQIDTDDYGTN